MWITLDEAAVLTRLSSPELTALKTAALAPGQANPLPEIIEGVIHEVRGAIGQNPKNILAEGSTIPKSAVHHALALIRSRLASRLPGMAKLMDDLRRDETRSAERWMLSKPLVVGSAAPAPALEQVSGPGAQIVSVPGALGSSSTIL